MKQEIILIVPPLTYRSDSYLTAAKKLDLATLCALDPAYGLPDGVENYFPIVFDDPMSSAAALVDYAMARPVRAVVSIDDGGGEIASLTSQALGFAYNSLQAINASNNKRCMRMLLDRANVPSPSFEVYRVCENPYRISTKLEYPVVVKPLFLSGSRGVIRANNPDEFVAAFRRVSELLSQPGTGPEPKSLLVEDYIPGVEVSLEGVLDNGKLFVLSLYDKPDPLEGPYFEETLFIKPSRLPDDVQTQVIRCSERALKAVGLYVGPVHVELRVNEAGPWIVEFGARTIGGHCSRALPFEGGLTLEELVLSQACGFDTNRFVPEAGAHGVMMIPIPGEGIYRSVRGVKEAEAITGVSGVMITVPADSTITPLPEGDKYVGFIFAKGENPSDVERALRTAHSQLEFKIDPITRVRLRIGSSRRPTFEYMEMIHAQFGAIAQEYLRPLSDGVDTGRAREFYQSADILGLPRSATASALGCGDPSKKANYRPGETVLDLGCGSGIDSLIAARAVGETGRVIGIDMVDYMVLLARHNQAKMGLHQLEFLQGEIEEVPLPEASVDVVISNNSVNLSADKDAVFREMFRVLKPGGRFVICDMAEDESMSLRRDRFSQPRCSNGALTPSEFLAKLKPIGFTGTQLDSAAASEFSCAALRVVVVGRKPE